MIMLLFLLLNPWIERLHEKNTLYYEKLKKLHVLQVNDHESYESGSIMQYLYKEFVRIYKHVRGSLEMF